MDVHGAGEARLCKSTGNPGEKQKRRQDAVATAGETPALLYGQAIL